MSDRYHAIWMNAAGQLVVSTNDDSGLIKETVVDVRRATTDEPVIVTEDGVDEGNERILRSPYVAGQVLVC